MCIRKILCAALCAQCAQQVQGQVRPCLTEEELQEWEAGLEVLAAAQAFYQLLLTEEAVTPQSITAGEVKLTQGGGSERAALLVEEKRRAVAPALEEPAFIFPSEVEAMRSREKEWFRRAGRASLVQEGKDPAQGFGVVFPWGRKRPTCGESAPTCWASWPRLCTGLPAASPSCWGPGVES